MRIRSDSIAVGDSLMANWRYRYVAFDARRRFPLPYRRLPEQIYKTRTVVRHAGSAIFLVEVS